MAPSDDPEFDQSGSPTNQELFGDFAPGELDALIEEGEQSGPPLDGQQVMAELRALRKAHEER
jgi:hypothetical protein